MANSDRRDVLRAALEAVGARLSEVGAWHCLAFGTLLGAVRDSDVIEWDHDIDLFVRPRDLERIAASSDEHVSFGPLHMAASTLALRPGGAGALATVRVPGLTLTVDGTAVGELWAPVLFADGVLRLYDLEHEVALWPQSALPAFILEELATVQVRGRSYPAPRHAAALLEWLYGEDWRVPRRAAADGGERADGRGRSGDRVAPALAAQIAWCEAQGWDRARYGAAPAWPRRLAGAGPTGTSDRAAATSGSDWWRTLDEVSANY